jgi:hypothetical protein
MTSPTQAVSSVQAMRDRVWFWLMCYSRIDFAGGVDSARTLAATTLTPAPPVSGRPVPKVRKPCQEPC